MKKAYLLVLFICISAMSYAQSTFKIIAHRGAMGYEMQNSINSFKKALELNAAMIELDVFVLPTGELVVFHDDELDALSDGRGPIESYPYHKLQEVRLNDGQSIPLLSEVLDLCASKTAINIELKGAHTAQPVQELLTDYFNSGLLQIDQVLISSFKWEELELTRALNNKIPIGILTDQDPLKAIEIAKRLSAVSINPYYKTLDQKKVDLIHANGFQLFAWTVNDIGDLQKMKDMGVDGVFCNYPDRGTELHR